MANLDDMESLAEQQQCELNERRISRKLSELLTYEPQPYVWSAPEANLAAKSKLYDNLFRTRYKRYMDKRLIWRSGESDLNELKTILDNFESLQFIQLNQGMAPSFFIFTLGGF